jgi:DNA repair protein RadA
MFIGYINMTIIEKDNLSDIPGVGPATALKLEAAGFTDFASIGVASSKEIAEKCEIGEATAVKIIAAARSMAKIGDFISASTLKEQRSKLRRLTTGSKALDNLFKNPRNDQGGLESASITEFFGEFGSGKTQLCFQLAVNTTMPVERGGLDADALIIDTEGTFRPARIEQIAIAQDLDPDKVLDHIHVARAFNSAHQMLLLENKAYELAKECNVGLIIIDSLTSHFRSEFVGRGNLAERQGQLAKHMRELLRYTYLNNCVGVITNQVMANPGQLFGDPTKPVGGHVLGHASTNRLYLRKAGKGGKRNARMIDSPEVVEDEVIFVVSEAGIRDE